MSSNDLMELVKSLLAERFSPAILQIKDESAAHAGHAGAQGGMKHLSVTISSNTLDNMPKLMSHKAIYETLGDLMRTDIHALRIKIIKTAPGHS